MYHLTLLISIFLFFLDISSGLVEGFSEERDQLSTRLKDLEDREAVLVMENETLRNKLHDLQMSESEVKSLHQEVQRQQTILYDNAGREHQGFCRFLKVLFPLGIVMSGGFLFWDKLYDCVEFSMPEIELWNVKKKHSSWRHW